jgi:general stress protein 26
MPKEYGILDEQSGSGLLPWTRASERLVTARNYWIHTTRSDGRPHAKPVWGVRFEEQLYFGTSPKSVDGENISTNASLVVHLESGDDVVILEGTAETVSDQGLSFRLDEAYHRKYSFH